jgi:hypothetical protein
MDARTLESMVKPWWLSQHAFVLVVILVGLFGLAQIRLECVEQEPGVLLSLLVP